LGENGKKGKRESGLGEAYQDLDYVWEAGRKCRVGCGEKPDYT
jgi:hypothetical protein